jgi:molybdenum cofactor cytidylyltransferase
MRLCEALKVRKGEIVSFVGAGGKTTAMFRLSRELADQGWRVIATTTTMIRPPLAGQAPALIVNRDRAELLRATRKALGCGSLVVAASNYLAHENKLQGIGPDLVPALLELADAVLVEADGSKGLPIKAPAAHEPVVPAATSLLVPVVGIDAVGRPLNGATAHRPELLSIVTGLAQGEQITIGALATLLTHEQGSLKGAPPHARVIPLINKVEDVASLAQAQEIARRIKRHRALNRVLIGAVAGEDPIAECWRRVAAVVLAAGASTRLGSPKQLLHVPRSGGMEYLAGRTMIEQVLATVRATSVDEVIVVLGYQAERISEHVPPWCRIVLNRDWAEGISSSIRAGLAALQGFCAQPGAPGQAEAALFVLVDQPYVRSQDIELVLQASYGSQKAIVVPTYQGRHGNPVLFDQTLFPALQRLRGDVGGRQLLTQFQDQLLTVEMPSADPFLDIDTPADYRDFLTRDERTETHQ